MLNKVNESWYLLGHNGEKTISIIESGNGLYELIFQEEDLPPYRRIEFSNLEEIAKEITGFEFDLVSEDVFDIISEITDGEELVDYYLKNTDELQLVLDQLKRFEIEPIGDIWDCTAKNPEDFPKFCFRIKFEYNSEEVYVDIFANNPNEIYNVVF